jgi:uncharacterized protein YndB with AHSA1/START domain
MSEVHEITAQATIDIAAPPQRIWKALTSPEKLKAFFFGADVASDFQVGSPIRMSGDYKGKAYTDKGTILAAVPDRRLSFSHWSEMSGAPDKPENYHVVTFDLVPSGNGTKVRLSQSNLTGGVRESDVKNRAQYEKNWQGVLEGLKKVVEA